MLQTVFNVTLGDSLLSFQDNGTFSLRRDGDTIITVGGMNEYFNTGAIDPEVRKGGLLEEAGWPAHRDHHYIQRYGCADLSRIGNKIIIKGTLANAAGSLSVMTFTMIYTFIAEGHLVIEATRCYTKACSFITDSSICFLTPPSMPHTAIIEQEHTTKCIAWHGPEDRTNAAQIEATEGFYKMGQPFNLEAEFVHRAMAALISTTAQFIVSIRNISKAFGPKVLRCVHDKEIEC